MKRCPTCQAEYADGVAFCARDGAELEPADRAPARTRTSGEAREPLAKRRARRGRGGSAEGPPPEAGDTPRKGRLVAALAVALVVVLAAGGFAAYTLAGAKRLERQAIGAVERGDLVTPPTVSARAFYDRLRDGHPRSAGAETVAAVALPAVLAEMDAFYARWHDTSEDRPGDWDRMAQLGEWASELAPDDPHVAARAAYARARQALDGDDVEGGRAAYAEAIAAWPEWALPHNSLGVLAAQNDDADGAIESYRTAAELDGAWSFPLQNLGGLYLRLRRYGDAQAALTRAVAVDPSAAMARVLLARAHAGAGDYDDAVREAEAALGMDPVGEAGFDARKLRSDAEGWQVHSWYDDIDGYAYGQSY